jgi:hypothetical protein
MTHDRKVVHLLNSSNNAFHEANPAFSPDGKWLAFTSNESGRPEVYIQAFQSADSPAVTGERYLVSRAGAQALRWRRDGKELCYLGFDGRVHAVPVLGGHPEVPVRLSPKPEFVPTKALFTISTKREPCDSFDSRLRCVGGRGRFVIPVADSSQRSSLMVVQNCEELLRS